VARASNRSTKTESGVIKGKLAYLSPEQCEGLELDGRADIFSLGACLYETLTGEQPFRHENEYHTLQAIVQGPVPSIREAQPYLPESLDAIAQQALAKHPADRFQTASDFEHALEEWLRNHHHRVTGADLETFMESVYWSEIQSGPTIEP